MKLPETDIVLEIIQKSSNSILEIYEDEKLFNIVDFKSDHSPLTLADKRSHGIIVEALLNYFPDIPVLSEEGMCMPYEIRKNWEYFWLVDPLDGTKEFLKRNGEFTVNIALIKNSYPEMGFIHIPVKNVTYYSTPAEGVIKVENGNRVELKDRGNRKDLVAVRSKSHSSPEEEGFYNKLGIKSFISVGSAIKFCMVAEGKADLYYRHGPTMEWDTAAGQAIVGRAEGSIISLDSAERLTYNKRDLSNGPFICLGLIRDLNKLKNWGLIKT